MFWIVEDYLFVVAIALHGLRIVENSSATITILAKTIHTLLAWISQAQTTRPGCHLLALAAVLLGLRTLTVAFGVDLCSERTTWIWLVGMILLRSSHNGRQSVVGSGGCMGKYSLVQRDKNGRKTRNTYSSHWRANQYRMKTWAVKRMPATLPW